MSDERSLEEEVERLKGRVSALVDINLAFLAALDAVSPGVGDIIEDGLRALLVKRASKGTDAAAAGYQSEIDRLARVNQSRRSRQDATGPTGP